LVTTDSHGKNVTITSNDEKANVLGNHFSQIFTKETKDIYDTSKIINRESSPNAVNFYFDSDNSLTQLRVVASSTSNDPGPRSGQHQQIGQCLLHLLQPIYSWTTRRALPDSGGRSGLLLTVAVPAKHVCSPVGGRCDQIMNDVW